MHVNKTDVGKRKKHRYLVRITNSPSGKRAAALELSVIYHRINSSTKDLNSGATSYPRAILPRVVSTVEVTD
jgi:hypothetical protein